MRFTFFFAVIFAVLLADQTRAQSGYIRESIGTRKPVTQTGPSLYNRPFDQWKGEKLVFAPKSRGLREFGYQLVEPEQPYDTTVGKVVTITGVERVEDGYVVHLTTDDGTLLSTRLLDSLISDISISELAPVRDIEWARQRWQGKDVWLKPAPYRVELMTYDAETDAWDSIKVPNATAVKVIAVVASDEEHAPVRLIMRTKKGEEGYIDVSVMNASPDSLLNTSSHYEQHFFESDPRLKFKWPPKVWAAIEAQKVFVGMTKEQARLSWGPPSDINRTTSGGKTREQWVFGQLGYLYFVDGILSGIQN